jgi:hypothetical protein
MDQATQNILGRKDLENFFLNSNIDINFYNFFIGILLSLVLAYLVKFTYIKAGRALNDKDYFSDTFIPLAIVTTLVITVVKFSLALSLGLVGALSIVRFRAAIKEPEELVYLFLVISIGLANGANQFVLSTIATLLIIIFLLARYYYNSKKQQNFRFNADANILNINITDNTKKNIETVTKKLEPQFKYLKLKSANIDQNKSNYVFWYEIEGNDVGSFLKTVKEICDKDLNVSIYSKTGAFE